MQLAEFSVDRLFGRFTHHIPFPTSSEEDDSTPSLLILHGANGVGKTTVLRMLYGIMELDFDIFRAVPVAQAQLTFNTGQTLEVNKQGEGEPLAVRFGDHSVELSPFDKGPADTKEHAKVEGFRETFFNATQGLDFELIDTSRSLESTFQRLPEDVLVERPDGRLVHRRVHSRRRAQSRRDHDDTLAETVARFISDAQVDYRAFFRSTGPGLFPRIVENLTEGGVARYDAPELKTVFAKLRAQDQEAQRLGLEPLQWNYDELARIVADLKGRPREDHALVVLSVYAETLESQAEARQLVADRLLTFERVMTDFYLDKTVNVNARRGFEIVTQNVSPLREAQLSSGEYHLLYLMVAALTTRRRGTVIAIDEPEMSMHIEWQRKLIKNIIECASRAAPQLILATHSPDIVGDYRHSLYEMS